ncbi:DedA family protein [Hufsiella ginkgonis]|uniref:DedA family protein n=1 Tax=Hufsiella ginkgonis TaxID=2695274 RepID=A0A7K1XRZ2_9SPHI|nr:DedA family protein [Hufsiella ginkgonis]MXV13694.1 DedA family protein [Hufsiella ginkgonis]
MEIVKAIIDFILHIDHHLSEIIRDYQAWTYLILFLIIFAETGFVVTPFLPGDSLLFAAGALIAKGNTGLDIYVMASLLCIAAVLGNTVNYYLGSYLGVKVFKENNKVLKLEYYIQTQQFFNKHGGKAVIFSRFMPIIRTIAPFVAGVGKMNISRYTLYNVAGGVAWVISFLVLGFLFGNIEVVKKNFTIVVFLIIIVSVLPAVFAAVRSKKEVKQDA